MTGDPWATVEAERRALWQVLTTLTPQQWAAPSLCEGWSVHDVAVHYSLSLQPGLRELLVATVRARGDLHRASRAMVAARADLPADELLSRLQDRQGSRTTPPGHDWHAPLTEVMLHGADLTLPLDLPAQSTHDRPAAVWVQVLDLLVQPRARRGFVPGRLPALSYVAVDADWTQQVGFGTRQVVGPARDLALAISGRPAGLAALSGPGAATLAQWL